MHGLPVTSPFHSMSCLIISIGSGGRLGSHPFTRSTVQTKLFLRTLNRATETTWYLFLFKLSIFSKTWADLLFLLKSTLQSPCCL